MALPLHTEHYLSFYSSFCLFFLGKEIKDGQSENNDSEMLMVYNRQRKSSLHASAPSLGQCNTNG